MSIDLTQIIVLLDYYIRKISELLNSLLSRFGKDPLPNNGAEFETAIDVLNPGYGR